MHSRHQETNGVAMPEWSTPGGTVLLRGHARGFRHKLRLARKLLVWVKPDPAHLDTKSSHAVNRKSAHMRKHTSLSHELAARRHDTNPIGLQRNKKKELDLEHSQLLSRGATADRQTLCKNVKYHRSVHQLRSPRVPPTPPQSPTIPASRITS